MNTQSNFLNHKYKGVGIAVVILAISILPYSANTQNKVMLVLGDSLSSEYLIPQNSGWVALLNKKLHEVKIINASVSGATTKDGQAIANYHFKRNHFDYVLIALGGNDFLKGINPQATIKNLTAISKIAQDQNTTVAILGIPFFQNYSQRFQKTVSEIFFKVSLDTNSYLVKSFIKKVAGKKQYTLPDGIHFNKQAQPLIADHVYSKLQLMGFFDP